jgi:hypothetical protein
MGQALAFPPKLFQEFLIDRSTDRYFDPDGTNIWQDLLRLFKAMNEGRAFGGKSINQFNGGLFAEDSDLDRLHVPNSVFCQHMQGSNQASLYIYKQTLLYLCAAYNYASDLGTPVVGRSADSQPSKNLGLYTLGRIFEQSITELEILEADADGRPSVNKLSKRKRDGVYYTPEWVVDYIVDETLGPRLAEIKRECGWPADGDPSPEALDAYAARLKAFTVLDPACGSGAFLITALRYLIDAWHEVQGLRRQLRRALPRGAVQEDDEANLIAEILRDNIYGVDINPASVEIAQLALWLHTARGDKPLSALDENIREGNSLIGPDFFRGNVDLPFYDEGEKERVNAFDWEHAFPAVFAQGGFDAVIGNPPYVKLQNFRPAHADMAKFLREGRPESSVKPYASTQSGNFDLYLPFIEKGISLLNSRGRLGYIAPSLWTTNEYGEGLRKIIGMGRNLARWIDFKSFQVFDEAINYTALQFFTKAPSPCIQVASAPAGDLPEDLWSSGDRALPYGRQEFGERWLLLTGEERALIDRLYERCKRLDDPEHTKQIFQGLITSADAIYHLERLGPGRYRCTPKSERANPPYEVEIEDALMKPLVSGAEAKRYVAPATDTYLLFPYEWSGKRMRLIDANTMQANYPRAWAYLNSYRDTLRTREARRDARGNLTEAPFDDEQWYRFGRHQNLDKQEIEKLVVAETVTEMRVCIDETKSMYLNNVRVNGIVCSAEEDPWYLLGVLNAKVANFVFCRIAKVKAGGFFEANKQFIAPLPVPPASMEDRSAVGSRAKALQAAHTARRGAIVQIERRLSATRRRNRPETWLFPDLTPKDELIEAAPARLDDDEKQQWADQRYNTDLAARYEAIGARLRPDSGLTASLVDGELSFAIDGVPVIRKIFVSKKEGEFIAAQWKVLAVTFAVTEKTDGKKLAAALRRLAATDNPALVQQIIALERELASLEADITRQEAEMNALVYRLYDLSQAEIALIDRDMRRSPPQPAKSPQ